MKAHKQKNKSNKIKYKIMASIVLSGLIIVLLTAFIDVRAIKAQNNNEMKLIEEKSLQDYNQMIKDDVNIALGMMQYYYDLNQQGVLEEKEAKNRAIEAVKRLRYGKDDQGYFWIDDTQGNLIGHPMLPKKEGTNRIHIQDPNGVKLIAEIIDTAKKNTDGGFVDFMWEKPENVGTGELSPKRAYSKLFKPWGYIISTGNYIDDIHASINSQKLFLEKELEKNIKTKIILAGVFIIGLVCMSLFLSNRISKPIIKMTKNIGKDENGQIKINHLEIHTKDEIGYLAVSINEMTKQVKDFLKETQEDTELLNENITKEDELLLNVNEAIHSNTNEISMINEEIHLAAASIEKIDETLYEVQKALMEIAQKTEETTSVTIEVNERANRLKNASLESEKNTKNVYEEVKYNVEKALKEIETVNEINVLTEKINGIAEQTNLLSLNASIQAASSGSNGSAFSVVANEIHKLSDSAKETAKNIQLITGKIVNTVNYLGDSTLKIINFVDQDILPQYNEMVMAADSYSKDAENIHYAMAELNATFEELTASSNEILEKSNIATENLVDTTKSMNHIDHQNRKTLDRIVEIKQNSGDNLKKIASLKEVIEKFKL
ncbi:methyl-accepting chemotaxis protein [Crassaminicella profunda]|uniref:methyl-accepting chemotaxis protein n=1 Tax=Crassaminicella profunda TaxID=1286698 RepID=UPI001CA70715|nr:methyl-accepting chemotaxis protein [Crassaminicella profunda]QZY55841.1 methyl-accepting chemotaxis protein [Crassaminicella profunda]